MDKQGGIYKIQNTVNGKRYIGSSANVGRRLATHKRQLVAGEHHSVLLQRAWNKYGADAFEFVTMLLCDSVDLIPHEQLALDGLKPEYNTAKFAGAPMRGVVQSRHSVEARASKMRGIKRGPASEECKRKNAESHRGIKLGPQPAEVRARASALRTGVKLSPEHCAAIAVSQTGKKCPAVTAANLKRAGESRITRGRPWSPARRAAQERKRAVL